MANAFSSGFSSGFDTLINRSGQALVSLSVQPQVIGTKSFESSELDRIERGVVALASGSTSVAVTIPAVDTARAFVLFSLRGAGTARPGDDAVSAQLTNSTTVTFARGEPGGNLTIEWQVVCWNDRVLVQRGSSSTAASANITIPLTVSAPRDKSFVILSHRSIGEHMTGEDFWRGRITADDTLELSAWGTIAGTVEWQVITLTDGSVQHADAALTTGITGAVSLAQSVDITKSILTYSYSLVASPSPTPARPYHHALRAELGSMEVSYARYGNDATNSDNLLYSQQVASVPSGWKVRHFSVTVATSDLYTDISIGENINSTRSFIIVGGTRNWGQSNFLTADNLTTDNFLYASATATLLNQNTLRVERGVSGYPLIIPVQVVEVEGGVFNHLPPITHTHSVQAVVRPTAFIQFSINLSTQVQAAARLDVISSLPTISLIQSVQAVGERSDQSSSPFLNLSVQVQATASSEVTVSVGPIAHTCSLQVVGGREGRTAEIVFGLALDVQATVQSDTSVVPSAVVHSHTVTALGTRIIDIDRQIYYAESLGTSSNDTTSYQNKVTLAFSPRPNSEYFLLSSGMFGLNSSSVYFRTRVVNGATVYSQTDYEGGSGSEIHPNFSVTRLAFAESPGQQTIQYQYAVATAGTAVATLSDARLLIMSRHREDGYAESLAVTGASSTTYVAKITLALDVVSAGYYLCIFSGETDTFSAPHSTGIQLTVDGAVQTSGFQANGDSASWSPIGFAVRVFLSAGTRQIRVEHNTNATTRSDLRNARLVVLNLATFKNNWSNNKLTLTQTASTTPQEVLTLSAQGAAPGDNIIFASFLGGVNNTVQAHRWDLVETPSTDLVSRDGHAWSRAGASSTTIGYPYGWFFSRRTFEDSSGGADRSWQLRHWSTLSTATIWTNSAHLTAIDLTSPQRFGSANLTLTTSLSAAVRTEVRALAILGHQNSAFATISSESKTSASMTISAAMVSAEVRSIVLAAASALGYSVTTAALSRKEDIRVVVPPIAYTNATQAQYVITPGATVVLPPLWQGIHIESVRGVEATAAINMDVAVIGDVLKSLAEAAAVISLSIEMTFSYRAEITLIDAVAGGAFIDRLMMRSGGFLRTRGGSALLLHNEGFSSHIRAPAIRTVQAGFGLSELVWGRALDPHEVLYYTIDWAEELSGTSDVIASGGSTWRLDLAGVTAGLIIPGGAHSYDNSSATVWLSVHPDRQENLSWTGLGQTHKVTHQVKTLGGQIMERSVQVNVRTLKPVGS